MDITGAWSDEPYEYAKLPQLQGDLGDERRRVSELHTQTHSQGHPGTP